MSTTAEATPEHALNPMDLLDTDWLLSDEERLIRDNVRGYVQKEILPHVGEWFDEARLPARELAKAFVVLKPDTQATPDELVAHCRRHLAAYKVPRAVQFTAQLPMTSSGKIMRRLLSEIDDGTR